MNIEDAKLALLEERNVHIGKWIGHDPVHYWHDVAAEKHLLVADLLEALDECLALLNRMGEQCDTPACISFEERDMARSEAAAAIAKARL
jgi:hypothetical protein